MENGDTPPQQQQQHAPHPPQPSPQPPRIQQRPNPPPAKRDPVNSLLIDIEYRRLYTEKQCLRYQSDIEHIIN